MAEAARQRIKRCPWMAAKEIKGLPRNGKISLPPVVGAALVPDLPVCPRCVVARGA